jgi:hypothetical protein
MSDASLPHCAACGEVEYACRCPGREPGDDRLLNEALARGGPSGEWPPLLGWPPHLRIDELIWDRRRQRWVGRKITHD